MTPTVQMPEELREAIRQFAQSRATDDCQTCGCQNDPTNDMLRGASWLFNHLISKHGEEELDKDAAYAKVKGGYPDAPYPSHDYFVRGASFAHSQAQAQIAALKMEVESQKHSYKLYVEHSEAKIAELEAKLEKTKDFGNIQSLHERFAALADKENEG